MTSAASCRSMSTTPSARVPSRSCCAPARPRRVSRCAPICAGSCAISANVGPGRASPSGATATMPGPRRWNGARPTTSITSSGRPVRSRWRRKSTRRRRGAHRARFVEQARRARLRRNAPQGQILEPRATRRRPHRSHSARARHPFRRHQRRIRRGGMDLRRPLLRARAGREPHQAAQDAARFRSNVRRSAIANQVRLALHTAAYWLMLTVRDAIPKPRDLAIRRVLDLATAADQDRRPRHRNRKPRPSRFRRRLPGGRPLPRPARSPRPARTLNVGARSPSAPRHPSNAFAKVSVVRR